MKRLLLFPALLALGVLPAQAVQNDIHEKCLQAADYAGCVEVLSGDLVTTESQIDKLIRALKLVPSRLQNTNRRDFYRNIQPISDALGLVDESLLGSDYETYIYQQSLIVSTLLDEIAETWSDQITLRIRYEYHLKPVCDNAQLHIAKFNYTLGGYDGVQYQTLTQKVL